MAAKRGPKSTREVLEGAILADPDDRAAHAAYADFLLEQPDPLDRDRGELIRVQLALEEEGRPAKERKQFQKREKQLLDAHQREWLGELAPFLLEGTVDDWGGNVFGYEHRMADFRFRRGWLDQLHLYYLSLPLARVLKQSPQLRVLNELIIETIADTRIEPPNADDIPRDRHRPNEYERWPGLYPLRECPHLKNVRRFRLGPDQGDDFNQYRCYVMTPVIPEIVRLMPRLEELRLFANNYNLNDVFMLPTLKNLRVWQVYHRGQVHRLQLLTQDNTFRNLTHLLIHPHNAGAWWENREIDEPDGYRREDGYLPLSVVRPFLRSKKLPNLTHLQLRCSSMGDEGCDEIVRSGILKRLRWLDLRHGRISDEGARTLAACPDVKNLEWLDLDRNALTAEGIALVHGLGIPVRCDDQQTAAELNDQYGPRYLDEGEFE